MTGKLFIEVVDRSLGETFVVACTPPVRIGKQSGIGNAILLDRSHETVSRSHGVIEMHNGRYAYTDVSSNGSRIDGAPILRGRVSLSDMFSIEIGPCLLRPVHTHPFVLVVTDLRLNEIGRAELLPGRGLAIVEASGKVAFADLNRWSQRQSAAALRLSLSHGAPQIMLDSGQIEVTLNRGRLPAGASPLSRGDVLGIGDKRIEILKPGENYSLCNNSACNLLNPNNAEANCRWCGYHLAASGAVSRVII